MPTDPTTDIYTDERTKRFALKMAHALAYQTARKGGASVDDAFAIANETANAYEDLAIERYLDWRMRRQGCSAA